MKADRFFQFPLSVLSFGPNCHTRLAHIISWCIYNVGTKAVLNDKCPMLALLAQADKETLPDDFNEDDEQHRAIYAGCLTLEIAPSAISCMDVVDQHSTLDEHIGVQAKLEGSAQIVRTRFDLFMDAFAGRMPYRDFSVLCAIYATIGTWKTPRVISMETIALKSLGYKPDTLRGSDGASIVAGRADGASPLTRMQARQIIYRLEARGHFARVILNRRHSQYSTRMTRTQIHEWNRTRSVDKIAKNREEDRTERLKTKAAKALHKIRNGITTSIGITTHVTTHVTTQPAASIKTLIKTSDKNEYDVRLHAPLDPREPLRGKPEPEGNPAVCLERKRFGETSALDKLHASMDSTPGWFIENGRLLK